MNINKNLVLIFLGILMISLVSAEVLYCCEKTTSGAWCQNDKKENCSIGMNCGTADNPKQCQMTQTSCEATSYCKGGCCYNSQEGNCLKNTPQQVCSKTMGGVWTEVKDCNIPQCELGCCLIGDQAAFVTKTRCKKLSSVYGLPISFKTDIKSEVQCISSTRTKVMGACVFEKEFERTCLMITKGDCDKMGNEGTKTEFYEGKLCTNSQLNTNCAKSTKTTCVNGKDAVYFLDTCNNVANIYDSRKANDTVYWEEIITSDICGIGAGLANAKTCGNCDYFFGSTCKKAERGDNPVYGENICKDLNCRSGTLAQDFKTIYNRFPKHGETWCSQSGAVSEIMYGQELLKTDIMNILKTQNVPGSRYFRLVCYNGEITVEPCADYRGEICMQAGLDTFKYSGCVANRWKDCIAQEKEKDCNNTDVRDCAWITVEGEEFCVPLYSPGFDSKIDDGTCTAVGSKTCIVEYERTGWQILGGGDWNANGGKQCNPDKENVFNAWKNERNMFCNAIGDCGMAKNYLDKPGFYTMEDLIDISQRVKSKAKAEELGTPSQ